VEVKSFSDFFVTTSARKRIEKPIKLLKSGFDCPIDPYELLNAIDSTAPRLCTFPVVSG
jgi:hypothetical protein